MSSEKMQPSLEQIIKDHAQPPLTWQEPTHFDMSSWADQREIARRFADGRIVHSIDRVEYVASDLFEVRHPDQKNDDRARKEFVDEIASQGLEYGEWFQFPWKHTLERYPGKKDHQDLRTFRNKKLISEDGQDVLLGATVGVAGLSVGSNVHEQLLISGIGGTLVTSDFDTLTPSNLNRIRATLAQVGMFKLDIAACKTSEADPYIKQVHFRQGVTDESLVGLAEAKMDILYDEIDDLSKKALLRRFAKEQRIPLIMATDSGDTSIIDVERHDLHDVAPFNGRLNDQEFNKLLEGDLSPAEKQKMMLKIVGIRYITPRLLDSAMEVDKTLGGLPQLGTTASAGGSLAAVAAREILLGHRLHSGRYDGSPKRTLDLAHQTSVPEGIDIVSRFIKSQRELKANTKQRTSM